MSDREIEALEAIAAALSNLDRGTCARVLKWAEDRFVSEHGPMLDPKWMSNFSEGMLQAARELGALTPNEVLRAASAIYDQAKGAEPLISPALPRDREQR